MKLVGVFQCTDPNCLSDEFTAWYNVSEKWIISPTEEKLDCIDGETNDGPSAIYCYKCKHKAKWEEITVAQYKERYEADPPDYMISDDGKPEVISGELPYNSPYEVFADA